MGQMNGPHEVDLKDAGPVAWAQVPEREPIFTRARPDGIDGVIQPTQVMFAIGYCLVHIFSPTDISLKGMKPLRCMKKVLAFERIFVQEDDRAPFLEKGLSDRLADGAGSADHQNPLLLQFEIHFWASEIKTR